VEQWAEVRRLFFVRGLSQREIDRRTGLHRDAIRNAINSETRPRYERAPSGSKLDPFKDEIHRLLKADPKLPGQRVRELIMPLGFDGGKTIVDDYLRRVRRLFDPPRTFQRTIYRPGEICQFDLWEPAGEIPVGHGQTRKGWVVLGCLGYSRAGAGALIFSKEIADLCGIRRCLWRLGALPGTLVWDRQAGLHAGGGRPNEAFAAFCGQLRVGWHFCDRGDPQTNGHVERLHRTILEECRRPAFARYLQVRFTGLRRDLTHYLHDYNCEREHHGRPTAGRRPADLVYAARNMEPR
jgi:transposase